jgi:hypothetical protein
MQRLALTLGILFISKICIQAQSFAGIHTSNYDPLKLTFFNPAAMANSNMRWQVNIASFDIKASNDFIYLNSLKGIIKDEGEWDHTRYFKERFNGQPKNIQAELDLRGPSFMFSFGKNAVSLATRTRGIVAINDIDERFASSLFNYQDNLIQYLPSFTDERVNAAFNSYSEISFSYARHILDKGAHQLTAGVNVKLLDKIFFSSFTGNNITFNKTVLAQDLDSLINVGSSQFEMIVSNDLEDKKYKYRRGIDGVAFDLGLEYSFKPLRITKGYFIKVGAAVNDVGRLRQEYGNSTRVFEGTNRTVPTQNLLTPDGDIINFDELLDSLGNRSTLTGKFNVQLPTVLQFYADVKVLTKFYVFAGVQVNPSDFKKIDALANLPTRISVVPRFEIKSIGVFAPLTWDKYEGFSNGVGLRFGQFSLGSANIISSVLKKNFTAVDFFLSLSFGGKRRLEAL